MVSRTLLAIMSGFPAAVLGLGRVPKWAALASVGKPEPQVLAPVLTVKKLIPPRAGGMEETTQKPAEFSMATGGSDRHGLRDAGARRNRGTDVGTCK
jgi:hypothetical protein